MMEDSIYSDDFIDLGTITSRTEDANYPDDNVEDYWHLKRRFRANDVTANDWLLKFNFGAAKTVVGVFLNDVNFNKVKIQGHATDAWGDPTYPGTALTVSLDARVNRYKIYIPITGFNLQWMRIFIPTGTTAVGDYTTKWEVGSVVVLDSISTIHKNAYTRKSSKAFQDLSLPHGGFERVTLADALRWEGSFSIDLRAESDESSYWPINILDSAQPLVFYENANVTNKAYLCLRDTDFEANLLYRGAFRGNTIKLKELI